MTVNSADATNSADTTRLGSASPPRNRRSTPCSRSSNASGPRVLDLVGRGNDLRPELADASGRVRTGLDVHASPQIGRALRPPLADRAPLPAVSPRRAAGPGLVNRPLRQRQPRRDIGENHAHPAADAYPLDFGLRREYPVRPDQIADYAEPLFLVGTPLWVSSSTSNTRYGVYCLKAG
jgi:hypothetical protein